MRQPIFRHLLVPIFLLALCLGAARAQAISPILSATLDQPNLGAAGGNVTVTVILNSSVNLMGSVTATITKPDNTTTFLTLNSAGSNSGHSVYNAGFPVPVNYTTKTLTYGVTVGVTTDQLYTENAGTITEAISDSPFFNTYITLSTLGAAGGRVTVYAAIANGSNVAPLDGAIIATITNPDSTTTQVPFYYTNGGDGLGHPLYAASYDIAANYTNSVAVTSFTTSTTTNQLWTVLSGTTTQAVTDNPLFNVYSTTDHFGAAGGRVSVYAAIANASNIAPVTGQITATITNPDNTTTQVPLYYTNGGDGLGHPLYVASYNIAANYTTSAQNYHYTVSVTTNKTWTGDAGSSTVAVSDSPLLSVSATPGMVGATGGKATVTATINNGNNVAPLTGDITVTITGPAGLKVTLTMKYTNGGDSSGHPIYSASYDISASFSFNLGSFDFSVSTKTNQTWTADAGTVMQTPSDSPFLSAYVTPDSLGQGGGTATVYAILNTGSNVLQPTGNITATVTRPDEATVNLTLNNTGNNDGHGHSIYAAAFNILPNTSGSILTYHFVVSATTNKLWTEDAGVVTVLTADSYRTLSGNINFQGIAPTAAAQTVVFTFRPKDNSGDFNITMPVAANGNFRITNLPPKVYALHVKGQTWLAQNVDVDTTGGDASGVTVTLGGGDANNDNSVDSTDFGILIGAFNTSDVIPGGGYDPTADFNGDGLVDSTDFGILIGNFGEVGDL